MAYSKKYEQGRDITKQLFGEELARLVEDSLGKMSPYFQERVIEGFAFYSRPILDLKLRSAITIAALTALGRSQELVLHVRGGINVGFTEDQIREIMIQVSGYAGVPIATEALLIANEVFQQLREKKKD